jgi:hypothetical protein
MCLSLYFIFLGYIVFGGFVEGSERYQMETISSNRVVVLDTSSGEVWFMSEGEQRLEPVEYISRQWPIGYRYTPDETRDSKNLDWWPFIKKKLKST